MTEFDAYRVAGDAIAKAWNAGTGAAAQLPPIELSGNERIALGRAAVLALLEAYQRQGDKVGHTGFESGAVRR
jgi:hypothetical protein